MEVHPPVAVIPPALGRAVGDLTYWFVIGGNAVRCFCPYRPTRDVDFGVENVEDFGDLLQQLENRGRVVIRERSVQMAVMENDGSTPTLVGYLILEALDFVVDPKGQQLIANPASEGKWVVDLY